VPVVHLTPDDAGYPPRLRVLPSPPREVTVECAEGALTAPAAVAIVGTRRPTPDAASFATGLARELASRGVVIVSGGAVGIDASAHEGAIAAGGRTWVVSGTGHGVLYPSVHGPLFERVVATGGALVSPFAPGTTGHPSRFLQRNGVLVALADALVIVQARIPSGALNAALWARRLGRPRWVVCPSPWETSDVQAAFAGCHLERRQGADALTSIDHFLGQMGIAGAPRPRGRGAASPPKPRNANETKVLSSLGGTPLHVDEVVVRCGLPYPEVMTALLTLALDDVLVEGPEGSYRLPGPP